ncbi:MAG: hypothetical protein JW720_02580 [Sedimentisphaerales bacterium]|nr:hypothetical protein [Sedimentisphaerales bacterium]
MVKRISCRVVDSVPLGGSRCAAEGPEGRVFDGFEAGFRDPSRSVGQIFGADGAAVGFGEGVAGRVLDCLA